MFASKAYWSGVISFIGAGIGVKIDASLTKTSESLNSNITILDGQQRRQFTCIAAAFYYGAAISLRLRRFCSCKARSRVGRSAFCPDAAGERHGRYGEEDEAAKLFVIGESTVAGLGARTHELALAGQFAKYLSEHLGRSVKWKVIGKNGVTARRTIDELLPQMPR